MRIGREAAAWATKVIGVFSLAARRVADSLTLMVMGF
jgi:hypothetical protein